MDILLVSASLDLSLGIMGDQQWEEQRDRKLSPNVRDGGENLPLSSLFPLERLLQELLQQEEVLWQRNEMHLQSLRAGGEGDHARLRPDKGSSPFPRPHPACC